MPNMLIVCLNINNFWFHLTTTFCEMLSGRTSFMLWKWHLTDDFESRQSQQKAVILLLTVWSDYVITGPIPDNFPYVSENYYGSNCTQWYFWLLIYFFFISIAWFVQGKHIFFGFSHGNKGLLHVYNLIFIPHRNRTEFLVTASKWLIM